MLSPGIWSTRWMILGQQRSEDGHDILWKRWWLQAIEIVNFVIKDGDYHSLYVSWLVVTGTWISWMCFFPFKNSWEWIWMNYHPSWRSHIFQRGRAQPPTRGGSWETSLYIPGRFHVVHHRSKSRFTQWLNSSSDDGYCPVRSHILDGFLRRSGRPPRKGSGWWLNFSLHPFFSQIIWK